MSEYVSLSLTEMKDFGKFAWRYKDYYKLKFFEISQHLDAQNVENFHSKKNVSLAI